MKKSSILRFLTTAALVASVGSLTACTSIDVDTDEGLMKALVKREKLDKAIPKISALMSTPEKIAPYIDVLVSLYIDGSGFDREVITALAQAGDPRADKAFEKAASSNDTKQVMQAAYGIKKTKNAAIQATLLKNFDAYINPEVRRVILDTGTTIKSEAIAAKAKEILNGNLDETPYSLLRASCNVLEFQEDPSAASTLVVSLFHMDGVGHSLTTDCTKALMALGKDVAEPLLLQAYKLENKGLNAYVEKHPNTLTSDTIRNNMANDLALFRSKKAVEPMLNFIGDTKTIPIPGTLVIRAADDPAWVAWASLVGAASQASFFALNDIGVRGNEDAKRIFTDIFNWTQPYQDKFKNAIKLTGTTNIEVSQRVNAFRVLRENGLISTDETLTMINSLKGEEFKDEKRLRNWARASIGTDMVTYIAVTAKAGELKTLWQAFSDMKTNADGEFFVPPQESPDTAKVAHFNDNVSKRIDDVRGAFELAEKCDTQASCYDKSLSNENLTNFERIRIVYELGASGQHDYFETICGIYKSFDMFGQIYATNALANLGTADDIPRIEQLSKDLEREMSQINYRSAKPNLENLIFILKNK